MNVSCLSKRQSRGSGRFTSTEFRELMDVSPESRYMSCWVNTQLRSWSMLAGYRLEMVGSMSQWSSELVSCVSILSGRALST